MSGAGTDPDGGAHPDAAPVVCAKCGEPSPAANRYCDYCGAHLYVLCQQCGERNARILRQCSNCGHSLVPTLGRRLKRVLYGGSKLRRVVRGGVFLLVLALLVWGLLSLVQGLNLTFRPQKVPEPPGITNEVNFTREPS